MHTHTYTDLNMQGKTGHYTIAQLSGLKPAMLASSLQAVVTCNETVPRVCTVVLFIDVVHLTNTYVCGDLKSNTLQHCCKWSLT